MTRALVLCDDIWHPAKTIERGFQALGQCGFAFEFQSHGAAWLGARMNEFPLMVLAKANVTSSQMERPWLTLDAQTAFRDYVSCGGGLLVLHAGTSRYESLPVMNALIGGSFMRHPEACAVTMKPRSDHLLTVNLVPFTVTDEHYFMQLSDGRADVFLHSQSEHGVQPAGWARAEGDGRVCVLTPGHDLEVWLHPQFQKLLMNALNWVAKLTH